MRTKNGQFVKGQSGNPKGKPKGTKNKWPLVWDLLIKKFEAHAEQFNVELDEFIGEHGMIQYYDKFIVPNLPRQQITESTIEVVDEDRINAYDRIANLESYIASNTAANTKKSAK